MRTRITLSCTECKQRNYNTTKEKKNHPDRMETKKYCPFCKRHTLHRESKYAEERFAMAEEKKQEAPVKKTGFFKGVKAEFKKIIWPKKETVAKETGAVVFFGVALGVLIAIIDAVVKYGLGLIM